MSVIESTLLTFFKYYEQHPILIAYSGGIDSQVLLHALSNLCTQKKLNNIISVCHVNHGLSDNALNWEQFAQTQCNAKNIALTIVKVNIEHKAQQSLEAQARDARYNAIKEIVDDNTLVVTGHHNDDQAETFLLALKRGSGLKGLSAMKRIMPLGKCHLVRPLLNISRAQIENYAKEHDLEWIEDESNKDTRFDRNFIRHQIMPLFTQRWPSFLTTINRSAEHCQEGEELLAELAQQDLNLCAESKSVLSIQPLKSFSQARFNNVVRYFLAQHNCLMPAKSQLSQLYSQLDADEDKTPEVKVGEQWLRRYKGFLYLTPDFKDVSGFCYSISSIDKTLTNHSNYRVVLPDQLGTIEFNGVNSKELITEHSSEKNSINVIAPQQGQKITISFKHNNPACLPDFRNRSRPLKKVLQELAIPTWQRKRLPFIYYDNQLVAVLGYFVCKPYMVHSLNDGNKKNKTISINWFN